MIKVAQQFAANFVNSRKAFLTNFINNRSPRERQMIVGLGIGFILFLDFILFVQPTINLLNHINPDLLATTDQLRVFREDEKNKKLIEKRLNDVQSAIDEKEKGFIASGDTPLLLENLSKLAQDSGVKIISLVPSESKADPKNLYPPIPIKMNAAAGTHELGQFLSRLESGATYYKVVNVNILASDEDVKRHQISLDIEAYKKNVGQGNGDAQKQKK